MAIGVRALRVAGLFGSVLALAGCSHHNVYDARAVRVGVLTCRSVPGSGFSLLIHSVVDVECEIDHSGIRDRYEGQAGIALGLDLRWQRDETMRWAVLSATGADPAPGFLAGRYAGARASVTVGVGAGLNVLVGGGKDQISLQPISVETSSGAGVAGGIGYLYLESPYVRAGGH